MRRGVRRLDGGRLRVELEKGERELLRSLAGQLHPVLTGEAGDAALHARLYPPASGDPETEFQYRELVGDSLLAGRLDALDTFAETLAAGEQIRGGWRVELDGDEAHAWLSVVNDARLTLAMLVGVTSEADWEAGPVASDPNNVALWYLGWLEEELLSALAGGL